MLPQMLTLWYLIPGESIGQRGISRRILPIGAEVFPYDWYQLHTR